MSAKISVIIPAYNVGPFLADTIRSVLAQTRTPHEIIVVDDCSTDDSLAVAKTFRQAGCTVLSTARNSGSAIARNLAINTATGDLIAFLDGDDLWLDRHLEIVAGLLDTHADASLAFSSTEAFGIEQWIWPMVVPPNQPVDCFWQCVPKTVIPQMNVILRREAFTSVGGYRTKMRQTQDFDLFLRLAYQHPFVCTHEVTTRYRRHATSITWRQPKNALRGHYVARHLFWQEHKATMEPHMLRRYETMIRELWVNHLTACAARFDFDMLHFHLDQHPMIPGAEEPYSQWRRFRRLGAIKRVWEFLPVSLRTLIKREVNQLTPTPRLERSPYSPRRAA